jgi:hypothetical protein
MVWWTTQQEIAGRAPTCSNCRTHPQLVPMRFVIVCRNGHMTDVPWHFWAHFGANQQPQRQCRSKNLQFITVPGRGGGLESLAVRCDSCGAQRSLRGIASHGSLAPLNLRCLGLQPWQAGAGDECSEDPQVVQRGATNVYFGHTRSAIDIPPESNYTSYSHINLQITNDPNFAALRAEPDGVLAPRLSEVLSTKFSVPAAKILQMASAEAARLDAGNVYTPRPHPVAGDLLSDEWDAFLTPHDEADDRNRFITRTVPLVAQDADEGPLSEAFRTLGPLIRRVVLATRLREVRALTGFSRLEPSGHVVKPDLGQGVDWLPAVEVYGEGIFIALDEAALQAWETLPEVRKRATAMERNRVDPNNFLGSVLPTATPRFVLIHTLAHILIRQLAFECGYAAASIRERIYAKQGDEAEAQAGFLLYTAAGDVEGTLGGLARQGEPPRLARTILDALEVARWCSSDPICAESGGQGFSGINLGACHACALLPETSCDHANALLDRTLVVGSDTVPGFLQAPIDVALSASAELQRT